jgi:hypothetical protein
LTCVRLGQEQRKEWNKNASRMIRNRTLQHKEISSLKTGDALGDRTRNEATGILEIKGCCKKININYNSTRKNAPRGKLSLFSTASSPALRPTQTPIQWTPGALYTGIKRPEREADHSPPFSD